jgi:hypothetical protein
MFEKLPPNCWLADPTPPLDIPGPQHMDQDGYPLLPDGDFTMHFADANSKLNVRALKSEWAWNVVTAKPYLLSGDKIKAVLKRCLGVMHCINTECSVTLLRPNTQGTVVKCTKCKFQLVHEACGLRCSATL